MKRISEGNVKSHAELTSDAKAFVNGKKEEAEEAIQEVKNITCGLKNPCVFGKHNPNFNNLKSI